ncbi:MAG: hypothetical protein AAF517_18155 [Planctomycetota bacterium]
MISKTNQQLARFEAPTMAEALEKIREVFGDDGMIVGTRNFRRGGVLGMGGQKMVEVIVADTRSRIENVRRLHRDRDEPFGLGTEDRGGFSPRGVEFINDTLTQLRDEIQELAGRRESGDGGSFSHPFLKECYDLLVLREVDPRVADGIVREIGKLRIPAGYPTPARVGSLVRMQLSKLFQKNPPVDRKKTARVVCLVGPTGVGKTTTIAKLAARARINESKEVGLITLDTFRIGAVDQLEQYADLIGVHLHVVNEVSEFGEAIERCQKEGIDLVFVDTAGRSHRDELKMVEISEFLEAVPNVEVHLVLSCTTHGKTMDSIAERFSSLDYDRLILTKVDESVSIGSLVSSLVKIGKPVAYVTDGQNVPDDIMAGDPERLADLVLKSQQG